MNSYLLISVCLREIENYLAGKQPACQSISTSLLLLRKPLLACAKLISSPPVRDDDLAESRITRTRALAEGIGRNHRFGVLALKKTTSLHIIDKISDVTLTGNPCLDFWQSNEPFFPHRLLPTIVSGAPRRAGDLAAWRSVGLIPSPAE